MQLALKVRRPRAPLFHIGLWYHHPTTAILRVRVVGKQIRRRDGQNPTELTIPSGSAPRPRSSQARDFPVPQNWGGVMCWISGSQDFLRRRREWSYVEERW